MFQHKIFPKDKDLVINSDAPYVIEGALQFYELCPINKMTGSRLNPLELVGLITTGGKAKLLEQFLAELPRTGSMRGLDDASMLDLVKERLSTGCPAEDARFATDLAKVADVLFTRNDNVDRNTIEFSPSDPPQVSTPASE